MGTRKGYRKIVRLPSLHFSNSGAITGSIRKRPAVFDSLAVPFPLCLWFLRCPASSSALPPRDPDARTPPYDVSSAKAEEEGEEITRTGKEGTEAAAAAFVVAAGISPVPLSFCLEVQYAVSGCSKHQIVLWNRVRLADTGHLLMPRRVFPFCFSACFLEVTFCFFGSFIPRPFTQFMEFLLCAHSSRELVLGCEIWRVLI
uniref:charged multivesicular body protein 2a isoform X2 n=1 Tax=Podarcis muralis TaxID=64176 RepID=UPI00109F8303|nr:charged multivesicular body protein 2a isoform X2 [Podarcis muralis]